MIFQGFFCCLPLHRHSRCLCAFYGRAISGILHRRNDRLFRYTAFDAHRIGQKTDRAGCHSIQFGNCFFYTAAACGTTHACHIKLSHCLFLLFVEQGKLLLFVRFHFNFNDFVADFSYFRLQFIFVKFFL